MRNAFIRTLTKIARKEKRIYLLTADLGYTVFEEFREEFPERFYNVGVAEANMRGVAAGLALSGKIVFIYSIVPFVTYRCYDHIRNDLCYHNLNVKIIGVGGGYSYGNQGQTHHAIEDIGAMQSLPNLTVVSPGDPLEVEWATQAIAFRPGPVYMRLEKSGEPILHKKNVSFKIGRGILMKEGTDLTLLATGSMLKNALKVAELLELKNLTARVISIHTIKPIDMEIILKAAAETPALFTIEEHVLTNGLGNSVAALLIENIKKKIFFKRIGLPDKFFKEIGSQKYFQRRTGLSEEQILKTICKFVKKKGKNEHAH